MTNRGLLLFGVGLALVAGGLFALNFPVFIDTYDHWGWQIKCGTGFSTDLTQAEAAKQFASADVVGQCQSALVFRRAWTIPLAVIGWLIVTALLLVLFHNSSAENRHRVSSAD
jgi:hypothetical protein